MHIGILLALGSFLGASAPGPTLASIDSDVGDPAGGSFHTLTLSTVAAVAGGSLMVRIGGTDCTDVTHVNATTVTFKAPAKAAALYDVTFTNGDGASGANTLTSGYESWQPGLAHDLALYAHMADYVAGTGTCPGRASLGVSGDGSHRLVQPVAGSRPAAGATKNGYQTADLDGTNDWLDYEAAAGDALSTTRFWYQIVLKEDTIATDNAEAACFDNVAYWGENNGVQSGNMRSTGPAALTYGFEGGGKAASQNFTGGAWKRIFGYYDGSNLGTSINNAAATTRVCGTTSAIGASLYVGTQYLTTARCFDGLIAGVMISKAAVPDATARTKIDKWARSMWAL